MSSDCERCGKPLDPKKVVMMELSWATNRYSREGVPADESQGWFEFGADCARAIEKKGGELVRIGLARR